MISLNSTMDMTQDTWTQLPLYSLFRAAVLHHPAQSIGANSEELVVFFLLAYTPFYLNRQALAVKLFAEMM